MEEYKTKDLAEATALITSNQHLVRIERNGSICFFIFDNKLACDEISNKYFFGDLMVNARDFYEAMSILKNRIFK